MESKSRLRPLGRAYLGSSGCPDAPLGGVVPVRRAHCRAGGRLRKAFAKVTKLRDTRQPEGSRQQNLSTQLRRAGGARPLSLSPGAVAGRASKLARQALTKTPPLGPPRLLL